MSENTLGRNVRQEALGVSGSRALVIPFAKKRVHYVDDGLVMAEIGATCVALWRVAPDEFLFERQRTILRNVAEAHTEPIGFLCIVCKDSPPPDESLRKASVEMLNSLRERLACVAGVIEGTGFRSAITRSVMSGMAFVLSGRDYRVKFAGSVQNAATWMANYVELGSVDDYASTVQLYGDLVTRP